MQNASVATVLTITSPAIILVLNPYLFYLSLIILMFTCLVICIHIIRNCTKRDRRIDALSTRAIRRANANSTDRE